jgi:hypothetical protein
VGVGAWPQTPNPQSPIPNPQSPIPIDKITIKIYEIFLIKKNKLLYILKNY